MKTNPSYVLKEFDDEHILVFQDETSVDYSKVITLNEVGADIYKLIEKGLNEEEILEELKKEYDAPAETLEHDLKVFVTSLKENNIVND